MEFSVQDLHRTVDTSVFEFMSTAEVTPSREPIPQVRARNAIDLSMGIPFSGYNLYALGPPQTDKQSMVTSRLKTLAAERGTPSDWCYVRNFDEPAQPHYLMLPAGEGRRFRQRTEEAISNIRALLRKAFASEEYRREAQALSSTFRDTQSKDVSALESQARELGLTMLPTPGGFVFAPVRDGKVMEQRDFLDLNDAERSGIQENIRLMNQRLVERLQLYPQHEQQLLEQQRALQQRTAETLIRHALGRLRTRYQENPHVLTHLSGVEKELLANLDKVVSETEQERVAMPMFVNDPQAFFDRFKVNLLVDHSEGGGAPVLYESNPSLDNLVGKLEHRVEYGMPVTDFNLIRAGALHRANGGYLLLDAERVLNKPFAWEALKRALTDKSVRIESVSKLMSLSYSVSLEPDAIPLDVKVVLLGSRWLYHVLREYDHDFDDLFKVVADFDDHVDWTADSLKSYASLMAQVVADTGIRHLSRAAVGRVIEHCARQVEDQSQLSTYVTDIRDLLLEADYVAHAAGVDLIEAEHVAKAIEQRIFRLDRFRELLRENIAKGVILVDTAGVKTGQVNGLCVLSIGHVQFGQPSRITATARLGRGQVIDIERESHLGGNIHSKAVMIVSAFIGSRYAREHPLSLQASLVFEQSYAGVEGDSASIAEVCALLSAIIDRPIRQSLALTGSMDQHGVVQAIGGVNEKIEGFYDVCMEQGLTGDQGVIVPVANRQHLMLRDDVVAAVAAGRFHVYGMSTVDDAMALLFAAPGQDRADPAEIDAAVRQRIIDLHRLSREFAQDLKESKS